MVIAVQIWIVLTGAVAVFLTQSKHETRRRYACIVGMLGQPAWFMSAITAQQWGVLLVCGLYTLAWMRGIDVHWLQPWIARRRKLSTTGVT